SRRRHTRFSRDWSSDVCSSDLICMRNYMGWDNASTIATEVERPQRTYPRAMLAAVVIVALSYVLPFAAMWMTGLAPTAWETGSRSEERRVGKGGGSGWRSGG